MNTTLCRNCCGPVVLVDLAWKRRDGRLRDLGTTALDALPDPDGVVAVIDGRYVAARVSQLPTVGERWRIHGCDEHIVSTSGRWTVSGAKATIVLAAVRPYLRLRVDAADAAIRLGLSSRYKPATIAKMTALGWPTIEAHQ